MSTTFKTGDHVRLTSWNNFTYIVLFEKDKLVFVWNKQTRVIQGLFVEKVEKTEPVDTRTLMEVYYDTYKVPLRITYLEPDVEDIQSIDIRVTTNEAIKIAKLLQGHPKVDEIFFDGDDHMGWDVDEALKDYDRDNILEALKFVEGQGARYEI